MDALYFFRHSNHGDLELRYSLRGLEKHMPWIRKVWVFGDCPEFLAQDRTIIEHVDHEYMARVGGYRTPMTNFFLMLYTSSLIPGLQPDYLWLCDDFICIDDVSVDVARRSRYVEDLSKAQFQSGGLWRESLWRTYELLARFGYPGYNFETHAPTYYTKKRVLEAWCDFKDFVTEDRWYGMLGPTAILNHAHLHERDALIHREQEGRWIGYHGRQPAYHDIRSQCPGKCFLNFDDDAFGPEIRRFLEERFPNRSRFEKRSK